jgi:hypothetical protein
MINKSFGELGSRSLDESKHIFAVILKNYIEDESDVDTVLDIIKELQSENESNATVN